MTVKPLEEDFQRMGLSDREIRESLTSMLGDAPEADVEDDSVEEEDFEDDAYLSDLVGEDEDGEDEDIEDEDELDEDEELLEKYMRLKKGTAKERRQSKAYYRKHKTQISRAMKKKRKKGGYKRHMAKLARMGKGGARTRRVVSDVEDPAGGLPSMHEELMTEMAELAESVEHEPVSRFEEYAQAFNHIADLGEILALRLMDEDEDKAIEVLQLALTAESMLQMMEELGGALTPEEDEELEESLADAMQDVGETLDALGMLSEDEDEDELDEDEEGYSNPFLDMADELREARAKKSKRGGKAQRRMLLNPASAKATKKPSAWGKRHGKQASKSQLALRKDVRNKKAMIAYLAQVKAGKVAPGQPLSKSKAMQKSKAKRKAG